ncbi:soluble calcium-activated nucleotidase 1-like [Haliotis rubra]|uniref:soluble calcium-activated nucleotidase 1-like n=1 Tax=Haliotis rubra TaxID=36100 RepID=UPI001EE5DCB3|nr:soluble calcium-activated nucleotidase 1-like [Haliotis rubra]
MSLPVDDYEEDMISSGYPSTVHEWMKAIRRPTPYRVGNARLHLKTRTVIYAALFSTAIFVLFIVFIPRPAPVAPKCDEFYSDKYYFSKYPLTAPTRTEHGMMYSIGLITDLDTDSKSKDKKDTWFSYFRTGNFTISHDNRHVSVKLNQPVVITSTLSQGGRGMELSELVTFNQKLYSVDDRTGVVYDVTDRREVVPWVVLSDGNGKHNKGFKCEWAAVKNKRLYVGGLGKEWTTTTGEVKSLDPQWVKSVGVLGDVQHHDWHENYNALRAATGTLLPGYMIHESGVWSEMHNRWFFLPRRASKEKYDEVSDERRATNMLISADESFQEIKVTRIGQESPTHGFSSFKFVPGTDDLVVVALKSEEDRGKVASYILVFNIYGKILLPEQIIGNVKYEGIEFI